jgi:four helix bundle protein
LGIDSEIQDLLWDSSNRVALALVRSLLLGTGMNQKAEELKARTAAFARAVIALCEKVPDRPAARRIVAQLLDSATSVAANYRATCRARSRAEFVAKMGVVVEEADESYAWLKMLVDINAVQESDAAALIKEADELTAIFNASQKTPKRGRERPKPTNNPQSPINPQSPNQSSIVDRGSTINPSIDNERIPKSD